MSDQKNLPRTQAAQIEALALCLAAPHPPSEIDRRLATAHYEETKARTIAELRAGAEPVGRKSQIEEFVRVMSEYRLLHTLDEDGCGYPLLDALTPEGETVDIGETEISELAAELADVVHPPVPREAELAAENAKLRVALEWYADQVEDCRKRGSIGVPARARLDSDCGKRARDALAAASETRG